MDVSDASYYIQENNENKGSRMGHTKKILKKKQIQIQFCSKSKLKTSSHKYNFLPYNFKQFYKQICIKTKKWDQNLSNTISTPTISYDL
jgi:hypothetical protein